MFHLSHDVGIEVDVGSALCRQFLEVGKGKLVAILVAPVLGAVLLDGVVREMHEVVVKVLRVH